VRYGVIADVHGNLHALEAVLDALSRARVERILCAGDLVGYGPRPNECVARVAGLEHAVVVAGNHDLVAVGRLSADGLGPLPALTLEWTAEVLDAASRSYLEALPLTASTDDGVVVAHGSLEDPSEYVHDCAAGQAQLRRLGAGARALVLGHTHMPLSCGADDGPWLFNPGSVGQSRERRPIARAMVLEPEGGTAEFLELEYDVRATRRELRAAGLPSSACHLAPGRRARLRRKLERGAASVAAPLRR
jgi:putative phosphoesterase